MKYTRSHFGALIFGLYCAMGCGQKDPNDGLNDTQDTDDTTTDATDDSATTNDTTSETTTESSETDATSDVEPDATETSDSTDEDTDAATSGDTDAGSSDDVDTTNDQSSTATSDDGSDNTTSDSTSGDTTDDLDDQICPIVEGATWTYKHTDWTEVQTVTTTEYEGEAGFIVKDTPDPEDDLRADTVLVKRDGRLLRVYKEQYWVNPNNGVETLDTKATYGVGFVRCDEAWASKETGWSETPEYIRIETVGEDPPKAPEERSHTFTVEGQEDVSTSNGKTYANCTKVRRSKDWAAVATAEDAQEKLYWFCPGVGKVREENVATGNFEELVEYSLPE